MQPRHPQGTPAGGQFAPIQNPETADLVLTAEEEWENAQGTFDTPAAPISAAQVIKFWAEVPIREVITLTFIEEYYEAHKTLRRSQAPKKVHAGVARVLMRAWKAHEQAQLLDDEERDKVMNHEWLLPGTGTTFTTSQLIALFHLDRVHPRWTWPTDIRP